WIADLRDSIVANADRPVERLAARVKERGQTAVVRLIANRADAIVTVSEAIAEETQAFEPKGRVTVIANGCDFDDFAGLEYRPGDRFRITHTGSFFGKRDPRPFLQALAGSDPDVVAPDDVRALREALAGLVARWRAGALNGTVLDDALRDRLSRRKRVEELADLLWSLS